MPELEYVRYLRERLREAQEADSAATAARNECWLAYTTAQAAQKECAGLVLRLKAAIAALEGEQDASVPS